MLVDHLAPRLPLARVAPLLLSPHCLPYPAIPSLPPRPVLQQLPSLAHSSRALTARLVYLLNWIARSLVLFIGTNDAALL